MPRVPAILTLLLALAPAAAAAQSQCGALLQSVCLQRVGAGAEEIADAGCRQQLDAYKQCLSDIASSGATAPSPAASSGGCSEAQASQLWEDAKLANDCLAYQSYQEACPNAPQSRFAESALRRLGCDGSGTAAAPRQPSPQDQLLQGSRVRVEGDFVYDALVHDQYINDKYRADMQKCRKFRYCAAAWPEACRKGCGGWTFWGEGDPAAAIKKALDKCNSLGIGVCAIFAFHKYEAAADLYRLESSPDRVVENGFVYDRRVREMINDQYKRDLETCRANRYCAAAWPRHCRAECGGWTFWGERDLDAAKRKALAKCDSLGIGDCAIFAHHE